MADNKKEQERQDLFKTIWATADKLRCAVDGWEFKQYILGIMFYRFISENITNYVNKNEHDTGNLDFNYENASDEDAESIRNDVVTTLGYYIKPSELFSNVTKNAKADENLNITLKTAFDNIVASAKGTDSETDFEGLFDDIDVNSVDLGSTLKKRNERLTDVLTSIASMKLSSNNNSIDAFGDAYEFLMGMYASNAGKSGGEFYTPQEVSELLVKLATRGKKKIRKIYDPACGSGSLLLKAIKVLGKENIEKGFFGQEINRRTYNLCRINMFLHGVNFSKFSIECEDTLTNPQHWDDEPFDAIVENMPYSIPWKGDDDATLINDPRFAPAGVLAPKSKADLAFVMHSLSWLSSDGIASIVCFPGIMYRGGAEQKIRKYLVDNNFVESIIQLPDNLFYGTSIATCIMTLRKDKKDNKVIFVDASSECIKVTNSNKLTDTNINNIVDYVSNEVDVDYKVKVVSINDIAKENYNLSVSTYVEKEDTREKIDIKELNKKISETVARENELRLAIDEIIKEIEG